MYELVQVGKNSYYIESPAKVGLYLVGHEAYLIDSGSDKDAGRKIKKILEQNGWDLKAIINTHSNADHIGGNNYLQSQTGCKIYGKGIEVAFTENPILEPSFLYGGFPCKDLRHKFLMAKESRVLKISETELPQGMEIIDLPGHFFDMIGIRTPDDVFYLADCLSSKETLEKYRFSFIYDVAAYLSTLEKIRNLNGKLFVPAHTSTTTDLSDLVNINEQKIHENTELILSFCETPSSVESILKQIFDTYGLVMDFQQYVLVGSTVKSYLSWLRDKGELDVKFENNRLLWVRT
ncbi:MBL fold metallo-hydrolase [Anaerocolumna jejuensis]|uniref:MBL fold metallo-hydrolase n=1 Tax=Anaerocolumna jejuensis TaxID=259063 RepID=UPI003F7BD182